MPLTNTSTGELVTAAWLNAIVDRINSLLISATGGIWTGTVQKVMSTFRGLKLRTHYNGLAAPSQVAVMAIEEIVMDDGVRYKPAANLFPMFGDITVSGPGGLDTGTEAASTWYEIYMIGKTSTALPVDMRVMFHKAKTYTADAAFTTATDASRALRRASLTATDKLAQGLQFGSAGAITFIDVAIQRAGAVSGTVWFTLQTSTGTDATGTVLATTYKIDASVIHTTAYLVRIPFSTYPTVATGTQYHLVMEGDYTRSDTVNISWYGVAAGGYGSGTAREQNGVAWAAASGVGDFFFRAYLKRNDTALTYPVGYDHSCKIGYVYNNGSSNFVSFIAFDKDVRRLTGSSGANDWGAVGSIGLPTLVDLSSLIPPSPVIMQQAGQVTVAGNGLIAGGVPDGYAPLVFFGDFGAAFITAPAANYAFDMPELFTDYQGAYTSMSGSAATGHIYLIGWKWLS